MTATVEDIGVWRTARRLIGSIGDEAAAHVVEQACEQRLDAGDIASLRQCQRILFAIHKLSKRAA